MMAKSRDRDYSYSNKEAPMDLLDVLLQDDLFCFILEMLPMKDCVRTSELSPELRYKWTKMNQLDFNGKAFPMGELSQEEYDRRMVRRVYFMLAFCSRVDSFSIDAYQSNMDHVETWIQILANREYELWRLILSKRNAAGGFFRIPDNMYELKYIQRLGLRFCILEVPKSIGVLSKVEMLVLKHVRSSIGGVDRLIANSRALEMVFIKDLMDDAGEPGSLTVASHSAPNLARITLMGHFLSLVLGNTPTLLTLLLNLKPVVGGQYDLAGLHSVRNLTLAGQTLQVLSEDELLKKLPRGVFRQVQELTVDINYSSTQENQALLHILRRGWHIRRLELTPLYADVNNNGALIEEIWKSVPIWDKYLTGLVKLVLKGFTSSISEMNLVTYVLEGSQHLETVEIYVTDGSEEAVQLEFAKLGSSTNRASVKACLLIVGSGSTGRVFKVIG